MRIALISLLMIPLTVGCAFKMRCEDTGGRGCDTAVAAHADTNADADADADGGVDNLEGDEAGECSDGEDNDRDGLFDCDDPDCQGSPDCSEPYAASCLFGPNICIEPNEPDNTSWCESVGGSKSFDSCPSGANGMCEIPAGGDYTDTATAYYYNDFDGQPACEVAGGTYTGS